MKKSVFTLIALVLFGCTDKMPSNDSVGYDDYSLYDYYTDGRGGEGVVAYKGSIFMVVISSDETTAKWGPEDRVVMPFNDYANVKYPSNFVYAVDMNQMVERANLKDYPAFAWCQAKNPNGERVHVTSWILPSEAMLNRMFNGRSDQLDSALTSLGMTPLSDSEAYWTCTEDVDGYFQFADDDVQSQYDYDPASRAIPILRGAYYYGWKTKWQKSKEYRVRAVKIIHYNYPVEDDDD